MKKKSFPPLLLAVLFCVFFSGCTKKNRFTIDTSQNRVEVSIKRFDKDLIAVDTAYISEEIGMIYEKYPDFFPVYVYNLLDINPTDTLEIENNLKNFLSDTLFSKVNQDVLKAYDKVSDIEHKISDAFTYINHYFPEIQLPEVYFFVSGFNLSVMITDLFFGIGTDMYLGDDYELYKDLTYHYMVLNMKRENIAPDLVSALLFKNFPTDTKEDRLLDDMLYRGKVMYLLSVFMPDEKEEDVIGYTTEQLKWCKRFEQEIWATMIDQKHLFSTDNLLIRKYLNDAPFTAPVSQDSPGRLGTWVGWQIIKSYMNRHKDITLTDLMRHNDYQKILEDSGYRP